MLTLIARLGNLGGPLGSTITNCEVQGKIWEWYSSLMFQTGSVMAIGRNDEILQKLDYSSTSVFAAGDSVS